MVDSDKVSEINLKRLIRSCEKLGAQSGGVLEKDTKRTFGKYLSAAQKQRDELAASNAVTHENMSEYNRKIDFLRDLVNTSKMAMPITTAPTMHRLANANQLTHEQKSSETHTRLRAKRHAENSMRAALLAKSSDEDDTTDLTREEILQRNRNLQQSYTEGMAVLSASLKDTSYKIHNVIKEGNKSLNELNTLADGNVTSIQTENKKLKEHSDSTTFSTLSLCVLLVIVMMLFISTYMFMKMFPKVRT
eukprot:Phypoly_transcript_11867.p1 GENE.Phypoly_transcript_11867~~Phypoly_transcript_11867.p1  ORF type:complete len:248 (+),score=40.12 Phypoly_transcript_11867:103-846(+)